MWRQLKNIYHWIVAWSAHVLYGLPGSKLKLIGVTGTDGKTTTSSLIYHVLKSSGKKVSMITTISAVIGGKAQDTGFHVTTPDPHQIPKYLAQAVANGDEYMVFEITSHALDQHRAAPLRFEVSGITNITHEHLDYHGTMDRYIRAKAKLISLSKVTFINADQPEIKNKLIKYRGLHCPNSIVRTYSLIEKSDRKLDISTRFDTSLEAYNKYNFLLAYSICAQLGITDAQFAQALKSFRFPAGRMETIYSGEYQVIVDFAHTPHAITEALSAIRAKRPGSRLIHVFGSAGKRDVSKRPLMGDASAGYADIVILTEEDHRDEDPRAIANMIATGLKRHGFTEVAPEHMIQFPLKKTFTFVPNREDAVRLAVAIARAGDVLVATGKAHETTLCRGTTEYPYSEKESFLKLLK